MLTYFPAPYPEELWYSVLCRYHARSGNDKFVTTLRELAGVERGSVNVWYANQNFYGIFERLPDGLLDKQEVLQTHTLVPYVIRFAGERRKKQTLDYFFGQTPDNYICATLTMWPPREEAHLRYCPLCVEEDTKRYGETYWRCPHQIQMMPLCPTHGCFLEDSGIRDKIARGRFHPASLKFCPRQTPRFPNGGKEKQLTAFLYRLWAAPIVPDAPFWTETLLYTLQIKGYQPITSSKIQTAKLLPDMRAYWGAGLVDQVFEEKQFLLYVYKMAVAGKYCPPEMYALIGAYLDMDDRLLTDPHACYTDKIKEQLQNMAGDERTWSKKLVASRLNVKSSQLDMLAKSHGVEPFWSTTSKGKKSHRLPQLTIKAYVSEEEHGFYTKRAKALGMSSISAYMKYCLEQESKRASHHD